MLADIPLYRTAFEELQFSERVQVLLGIGRTAKVFQGDSGILALNFFGISTEWAAVADVFVMILVRWAKPQHQVLK